jgi:cytosine/adenosine deaminase-related metal-dependent hydrolase
MRTLLRNALWIHAGDPARPGMANGQVSVVDGRIECVQSSPVTARADETIDLDGCLLIPGLINTHHHFFQSLTRALPEVHCAASEDWLAALYPVWARMDAADIAAAARNAAAELLLSGVTTSVDHAFLLRDVGDERLAAQVEAARELGLRLHLVRSGLPAIGARVETRVAAQLGPGLPGLIDDADRWLAQCAADLARWHDPAPGSMLRLALGPSNVDYTRPELMRSLARLAREHGCGLHAHLHPRAAERELSRRHTGLEPVAFLEEAGWLGEGRWFAHCTELNDAEIERFAATGTGVSHCPRTVIRLGYRMPRIGAMRRAGVPVSIGADGAASNDGGAFVSDLRLALLLHRAGGDAPADWLEPADALDMATRVAARTLGRGDIGSIAPGMRADLAAFDLSGLDCAGALDDPAGGFLLAGTRTRAKLVMVEGRVVVRDGRLATGDEARIAARTRERSRALLARARTGLAPRRVSKGPDD